MLPALRSRNFRLLWIGLGISFAGSFMQQAAILWHVSLLVAPERKALALGLVGLVRVVPIIAFSAVQRRRGRRVRSPEAHARDAVRWRLRGDRRWHGLPSPDCRPSGPSTCWPALGAAVGAFDPPSRQALVPDAGAARASAERAQPQHGDVQVASVDRPGHRRHHHRHAATWPGRTPSTRCRSCS